MCWSTSILIFLDIYVLSVLLVLLTTTTLHKEMLGMLIQDPFKPDDSTAGAPDRLSSISSFSWSPLLTDNHLLILHQLHSFFCPLHHESICSSGHPIESYHCIAWTWKWKLNVVTGVLDCNEVFVDGLRPGYLFGTGKLPDDGDCSFTLSLEVEAVIRR